jgi:hypothetical protein
MADRPHDTRSPRSPRRTLLLGSPGTMAINPWTAAAARQASPKACARPLPGR